MQDDVYCADSSLAIGEPLRGTAAADTDAFLLLEQPEPWGPKGVEDSGLPQPVVALLNSLSKSHPRFRVQLLRRPDRTPSAPAMFLARATPGSEALWEVPITSFDDLLALDLAAWLSHGTPPAGARATSELLYLVCVHGRRDRCCARRGMPVYSALRARQGDRVWQTTHLGGHRFAATLIVLPHGICYGRVASDEVEALASAHDRRTLHDLTRVRGRTAYSAVAQAAELLLREQSGELRLDALRWLRSEPVPDGERVTFAHVEQGEQSIEVARTALAPSPASCGASPKAGSALVPLARISAR